LPRITLDLLRPLLRPMTIVIEGERDGIVPKDYRRD